MNSTPNLLLAFIIATILSYLLGWLLSLLLLSTGVLQP